MYRHSGWTGIADPRRVDTLKDAEPGTGPVIYWMSRDQRVEDNWALLYARELAADAKTPLAVVFCLVPKFLGATMRQYGFMLKGLMEVEAGLAKKGAAFFLLMGEPAETLPRFVRKHRISAVVTDFDPLRIKRGWKKAVAGKLIVPFHEVDAHNIVPCRIASDRQEYGAYTLRPKINRLLPDFMKEFPPLRRHPYGWPGGAGPVDWDRAFKGIEADSSVPEAGWIKPGAQAGMAALKGFVSERLSRYAADANDPNRDAQSGLSPYLHFGQLSAQRVALEVHGADASEAAKSAFLEQLIVRRELSDNYCLYNPDYDLALGIPRWARETLAVHRDDPREYVYTGGEFEAAHTHDPLWNAAQTEMVKTGRMHGYMRMYWAKKILEWSVSPEDAFATAVYLNDRYELDGRDPNGYTGIAWSIGGVHDRPWRERPIFGKVRYMSYRGCRSKFDVEAYIRRITAIA